MYCVDHVFGLEDKHAPLLFTRWLARLWWLVILQDCICAGHRVCFLGQQACRIEVGLLLFYDGFCGGGIISLAKLILL
jgi:hypothetical protein